MIRLLCVVITLIFATMAHGVEHTPLQWAQRLADKVVDNTRFEFEYAMQRPYPDAEVIDFGRSCLPAKGVAYALSTISSECNQQQTFEVGSAAPIKIWIDGKIVFMRTDSISFTPALDEKSYFLPEKFNVTLSKGDHTILVKSEGSCYDSWVIILQATNMSRYAAKGMAIKCSLKSFAPKIKESNWLVLGTFSGDIERVLPPEKQIELYELYTDEGRQIAWNTPRMNLLVDNKDGGKFYNWSYHTGCFVWGLQCLGEQTGVDKYLEYADKWCQYIMSTTPMVKYQTMALHAIRSMNFGLAERPMLDYISAPAMPFVTRLSTTKKPDNIDVYRKKRDEVVDYLLHKQFRIDGVFARTYTSKPSVWADDMFMGLPFLVYASQTTDDKIQKSALIDDAASQIVGFNALLFDKQAKLYRQACYPSQPEVKVPFWSRGNGWAIWATVEVLQVLPRNHKDYKTIMAIYRQHIEGIVAQQDTDGFWRNVLDMPNSVRESSGAAIFTLALARGINNGWLPRQKYSQSLEKAWSALTTFVDENDDFNGVKGGTNFSVDTMDYERVPFIKSDTHGLLPFIFAAMEVNKYFEK